MFLLWFYYGLIYRHTLRDGLESAAIILDEDLLEPAKLLIRTHLVFFAYCAIVELAACVTAAYACFPRSTQLDNQVAGGLALLTYLQYWAYVLYLFRLWPVLMAALLSVPVVAILNWPMLLPQHSRLLHFIRPYEEVEEGVHHRDAAALPKVHQELDL